MQERTFNRLGRCVGPGGLIAAPKFIELAATVSGQARRAREAGAASVRAVATAAIRSAANGAELCAHVGAASGVDVEVLTGDEEARLAFVGATRMLAREIAGDVAVVDVGGGSSEVAVGTVAAGVRWSASLGIGSGRLADDHLGGDPPTPAQLAAARAHVTATLDGLGLGRPALAVAVGGSATSLHRLAGPRLDDRALERALAVLASAPAAELAERLELHPERVRLLPAGVLILAALAQRLGRPLEIGRGGLREGVVLELLGAEDEGGHGQGA